MSNLLKKLRKGGGGSSGDKEKEPSKDKGKQPMKGKGKRTSRNEGNDNEFNIVFRNDDQITRFAILVNRKIVCTRYMDPTVLDMLGIREDVDLLIGFLE